MAQHQRFKVSRHRHQHILEIRTQLGLIAHSTRIQVVFQRVAERARQRQQHKMSIQLLFDAALGLGVKLLDFHQPLGDFVQLFNAPVLIVIE